MANKTSSKNQKDLYKRYKAASTHSKNKIAKLKRMLKKQPNNKVIEDRIKELEKNGVPYTRNRQAVVKGENKNKYPKTSAFVPKRKGRPELPEWKKVLLVLKASLKPRIRVKKKRGKKHNRVSQTG